MNNSGSPKKVILFFILIALLVGGYFIYRDIIEEEEEKTVYTVEDFPNAHKYGDDEAIANLVTKLNTEYTALPTSQNKYQNWNSIGVYKSALADVDGAEAAWQHATTLIDNPWLALGNLADLYMYQRNDYSKAEEYYLRALEFYDSFTYYNGLATLYQYKLTDKKYLIEELMLKGAERESANKMQYYTYLKTFFEEEGNAEKSNEYAKKVEAISDQMNG